MEKTEGQGLETKLEMRETRKIEKYWVEWANTSNAHEFRSCDLASHTFYFITLLLTHVIVCSVVSILGDHKLLEDKDYVCLVRMVYQSLEQCLGKMGSIEKALGPEK